MGQKANIDSMKRVLDLSLGVFLIVTLKIQKTEQNLRQIFHKIIYTKKNDSQLMKPNEFVEVLNEVLEGQSEVEEKWQPLDDT